MTGERLLTTCTAACPACPCQTWGQAHTIRSSGPPGVSRGLAGAGAATSRPAGPRGPAGAGAGAPSQRPVPSRCLCLRPLGQRLPLCFGHRGCVVTSSIVQVALAHLRTRVSLPRLHSDASSGSALLLQDTAWQSAPARCPRLCPVSIGSVPRMPGGFQGQSLPSGSSLCPRGFPAHRAQPLTRSPAARTQCVPCCRALGSRATGPCLWVSKLSARLGLE